MWHVQHLSLESLVKMDHFQKEPPLNLKGPLAQGGSQGPIPKGTDWTSPLRLNVRYGSLADTLRCGSCVRFTPESGQYQILLVP